MKNPARRVPLVKPKDDAAEEVAALLRQHYATAPPGTEYVWALLERLSAELPARTWKPRQVQGQWIGGGAVAVVAVVGMVIWLARHAAETHHPPKEKVDSSQVLHAPVVFPVLPPAHVAAPEKDERPDAQGAPTATRERLPETQPLDWSPDGARADSGIPNVAERVGRSSLIVRTTVMKTEGPVVEYAVNWVIYGRCQAASLKVDRTRDVETYVRQVREIVASEGAPEPTDAELLSEALRHAGAERGKRHILYLRTPPQGATLKPGVTHLFAGSHQEVPGNALDAAEQAILQTIADGSFLEPQPGVANSIAARMRDASLIVRADLIEVSGAGSQWNISRVLRGKADEPRLHLDHDIIRLRAEALANASARREGTATAREQVQRQTDDEVKRLVRVELTVPKEAVLFLDTCDRKPDGLHARVRHMAFDDGSRKLSDLEEALEATRDVADTTLEILPNP